MRRIGRTIAALLVGFGLPMIAAPGASADGVGVLVGGGTLSPGVTSQPTAQSGSFAGTITGTLDGRTGQMNCNFSRGGVESTDFGSGSFGGSCTGVMQWQCSLTYSRITDVMTLSGTCNGRPVEGHLTHQNTSSLGGTMTSYSVSGTVSIGSAHPTRTVGVLHGTGTTSPGITDVPTAQSASLDAAVTGLGTLRCKFTLSGTDTTAQGLGFVSGSCAGAIALSGCFVSYSRIASAVTWSGQCAQGRLTADLVFVPTSPSGQRITSFTMAGVFTLGV